MLALNILSQLPIKTRSFTLNLIPHPGHHYHEACPGCSGCHYEEATTTTTATVAPGSHLQVVVVVALGSGQVALQAGPLVAIIIGLVGQGVVVVVAGRQPVVFGVAGLHLQSQTQTRSLQPSLHSCHRRSKLQLPCA